MSITLESLGVSPKVALVMALEELARRKSGRKIDNYYPDNGPLRRELYRKHLLFFRLGATCATRGFMAANRVGKTEGGGGYELTLHLTGKYPKWWEGRRFTRPIRAWVAGDTRQTTRDIIQEKLLGPYAKIGTGLIPADDIVKKLPMQGVPEAYDSVWVKHYNDRGVQNGLSRLGFKSFDQGREAFQGTEQDVIWLDEEADEGIRSECVLRLMTTNGLLIETFTPLKGITSVVMQYLPEGYKDDMAEAITEDKALIMAGWDDVPHLTEEAKRRMLSETPAYQRDARTKGIPSLGAGAIYPIPETDILVDDMPIPPYWPRAYALDVGWNRTAALWGAENRETGVTYLYAEYYRGQAEPPIHAQAIKTRGAWIPGVIDPAARGRGQDDGKRLMSQYENLGLQLSMADNEVESGIYDVWTGLSTGKIKVFKSLMNWRSEYRMYRRDEKGKIVKTNDHLMDTTRYLMRSGMKNAIVRPAGEQAVVPHYGILDNVVGL